MKGISKRWIRLEIGVDGDPQLLDFRIEAFRITDTPKLEPDKLLASGVCTSVDEAVRIFRVYLDRERGKAEASNGKT